MSESRVFMLQFEDGTETVVRVAGIHFEKLWGQPTDFTTFPLPDELQGKVITKILAID